MVRGWPVWLSRARGGLLPLDSWTQAIQEAILKTARRHPSLIDLAFVVALMLAMAGLPGCEYKIADYPTAPPMIAPPSKGQVTVAIYWHEGVDEIAKFCQINTSGIVYECSISLPGDKCVIHAVKPKDFNDQARIALLGHEFFHCLGAQHL